MYALLKSTSEEPFAPFRPLESYDETKPAISRDLKRKLVYMHHQGFDPERGGLRSPIKFIDRDSVEYALTQTKEHNRQEEKIAVLTLDHALALIDPVWGGIYQYSTQGRWDLPHYRKTISAQAGVLRLYALAFSQFKFKRYLNAIKMIQDFLLRFMLSEEGIFYSGQSDRIANLHPAQYFSLEEDERLRYGIPEIDKRILTRENGWIIEALATCDEYCNDPAARNSAILAARKIIEHCSANNGGFSNSEHEQDAVHLGDTLAMARAFLQLYRVTFDQLWLDQACKSTDFLIAKFKNESGGFCSHIEQNNKYLSSRQMDENISVTRFTNLLYHYSGKQNYFQAAQHGLRYLSIPQIATARMEEAGILLIEQEMKNPPPKMTVRGIPGHTLTHQLIRTIQNESGWYKVMNFGPGKKQSATIVIDNIVSKPVTSLHKLKSLLENT